MTAEHKLQHKMHSLVVLISCVLLSAGDDIGEAYEQYKQKYNLHFNSSEDAFRKGIFAESFARVVEVDERNDGSSYELGITEFAAMTDEEFNNLLVCNDHISPPVARIIYPHSKEGQRVFDKLRFSAPPKSVDWRSAGAVAPVRKQNGCGCCYAMATTEATEGILQIKTKKLVPLSVQQIVDCSSSSPFGNDGCKGGFQVNSYYYIEERGIVSESSYPYVAAAGACKKSITRDVHKQCLGPDDLIGWWTIKEGDIEEMLKSVAKQPVSAIIDAYPADFKLYKGGIYKSGACVSSKASHSVLITGYGEDEHGTKYWEFKNSWGTEWGMAGYGRLIRGKGGDGECGILRQAYYPLLADEVHPGEQCL
ncbi:hypothetical protein FOZ61_004927 [Perkinsus olseni]|uniref:Uncharacterized protein n=1 Tax=Perkinsus olseni TaxID=32597 RepID=A0A7J6M9U6_PEROL|nr:hypothetical protein FOZ61_004927 [Perkinsus olseni]KAF4668372.1 hypothetical protein FOL46_002037 [Perkinsus olseni]